LPPIHLTNIGSEKDGVTAAQLCKEILQPIISSAMKSGTEAATNIGKDLKDIGKGSTEKIGKTVDSLKGLFKK
jgi:hypothetical protein